MAHVLLDVDGVLADFVGAYLETVERETGLTYEPRDVTQWNICKALGLTAKQRKAVEAKVSEEGYAATLDAYPDAVDGVRRLAQRHALTFVTSPWESSPTWCYDRRLWLHSLLRPTDFRLVYAADKTAVRGDVLVDDSANHTQSWALAPGNRRGVALLWDQPWNAKSDPMLVVRVSTWDAVQAVADAVDLLSGGDRG